MKERRHFWMSLNLVKRNIIFFLLMGVLISLIAIWVIPRFMDRTGLFVQTYVSPEMSTTLDRDVVSVTEEGILFRQDYQPAREMIKSLLIRLNVEERNGSGRIYLRILSPQDRTVLAETSISIDSVYEEREYLFEFPKAVLLNPGEAYELEMSVTCEDSVHSIAIFRSAEEDNRVPYVERSYFRGHESKTVFNIILFVCVELIMLMVWECVNKPRFDKVSKLDVLFVVISILFCCIFFNQGGDMSITITHSMDLLHLIENGKTMDFYDYVLHKAIQGGYSGGIENIQASAFYNFAMYLVLAIILAPFELVNKILGIDCEMIIYITYFNIVLSFVLVGSAFLICRIYKKIDGESQSSKQFMYLYLTSATLMFATLGFSQMDIFVVTCFLFALERYVSGKYIHFSLIMSFAVMLKMFPLLFYIPLILLVEKRPLHIIKHFAICMVFTLVNALTFGRSEGYQITQKALGSSYGFVTRVVSQGFEVNFGKSSFFIVLLVLLCVYCFNKKAEEAEIRRYAITIPLIVFGSFVVFVGWHPQWLTYFVPFMILALGCMKNPVALYCEWGISVVYIALSACVYTLNADNYMINQGLFAYLMRDSYSGVMLRESVEKISPVAVTLIISAFSALVIAFCVGAVNKLNYKQEYVRQNEEYAYDRWIVLIRIATIYAFTLLLLLLYFYVG